MEEILAVLKRHWIAGLILFFIACYLYTNYRVKASVNAGGLGATLNI